MEFGRHGRLKICWPYGRVGSSPTASTGALGSAHRFRRKAQGRTSVVVNAHCLGAAVAKSPVTVRKGCCGEGRHVLFHVCGWCRRFVGATPTGVAGVHNLILARADAFPMVRDSVVASSKEIANALCENALRGWCLGMDWF